LINNFLSASYLTPSPPIRPKADKKFESCFSMAPFKEDEPKVKGRTKKEQNQIKTIIYTYKQLYNKHLQQCQ